jgi:hypothetical protein
VPFRRSYALAAAAAALLCGCGSDSSAPPATSAFADAKPLRPPAHRSAKSTSHRPRRGPSATTIGATRRIDAGDAQLEVTVRRVIDPLRDSGASLPPRTRAVGVLVEIRNVGSGVYHSSATGDISVVPSHGAAPPVFAPAGICQTQLRDFDNYITSGEVRDGCVVFAVRRGAHLTAIRFSPHAQAAHRAIWTSAR